MNRVLAIALFAALGGGAACNPIDVALDCHAICTRYQTCFDKNYDVGACESSCRAHSIDESNYRHKADTCSACIDDQSCASATFNCAVPCATVVP